MIGYPTTGLSKALRNKSERNGTQMTQMNMMNTDEIFIIYNYQRYQRSIFLTAE